MILKSLTKMLAIAAGLVSALPAFATTCPSLLNHSFPRLQDSSIQSLCQYQGKVILVVNKMDMLEDKSRVLPFLQKMSAVYPFAEIVPVSAEKGHNTAQLLKAAEPYLPEGEWIFGEDDITDRPRATNMEMRERMSGNLCRCGAYSNIADAMAEVAGGKSGRDRT